MSGGRQEGAFSVVVPTTGAALRLTTLSPRPGLPYGAAFAEGDYRPLPLSADYRALTDPEGPLARHLGRALEPHEMRLSGAPDGGRSWEAPVALAHLLLAEGRELKAEGAPTIWATGALDLDLRLLPDDYALLRKIDCSEDRIGPGTVVVLPPDPNRSEAMTRAETLGARVVLAGALTDALDAIRSAQDGAPASAPGLEGAAGGRRAPWILAAGAGAVAFAGAMLAAFGPADRRDADGEAIAEAAGSEVVSNASETSEPEEGSHDLEDTTSDEGEPDGRLSTDVAADVPLDTPPNPLPGPPPSLTVSAIRPSDGATCAQALFDPARRVLDPVPWEGDGYPPLVAGPGLCGVALAGAGGSGPDAPEDAFTRLQEEGVTLLFLRPGARNVVYAIPVDGERPPIAHRIVAPDTETD